MFLLCRSIYRDNRGGDSFPRWRHFSHRSHPSLTEEFRAALLEQIKLNQEILEAILYAHQGASTPSTTKLGGFFTSSTYARVVISIRLSCKFFNTSFARETFNM